MQVDSLKKGKRNGKGKIQDQRGNRSTSTSSTDINTCKNCGANLDIGRKTAGIPVEERMTIPSAEILAKARVKTQAKGKANTWTLTKQNNLNLLKQLQPCRIYPSQDPSVVGELSCISSVDPRIMGVTLNSVSSIRRQAGAEYLLLDSGAQLHACPITYPGQKIPLLEPGVHTQQVEQDSNMTEDDW